MAGAAALVVVLVVALPLAFLVTGAVVCAALGRALSESSGAEAEAEG